jgi:spore maturation protein CgeB
MFDFRIVRCVGFYQNMHNEGHNFLTSFFPSLLNTLLIQKKITAFAVEFIVTTVDAQKKRQTAMSDFLSSMFRKTRP